ncbi:nuclear transport factor 2 family protein [Pedobacter changchengzhani]|uniref:Nuclear transport factor 2 family protein n=1 Tax=Pedobacter changchengzhani TaxID=2529274 RepID=A0A4R5MIK7_9SPHI|nr:DUF4440 domain-containing protein [Pedobacter changchengzhani]TDG35206.1 nuclear transport factor 2 family protein [Pedobacter changchengzhani]
MKKIFSTALALTFSVAVFAQKSDGSTKSLVNAEKDFEKSLVKNGEKEAFLKFSADDALIFKPNPVSVKTFYSAQTDADNKITWAPNLAKVSRSGEFGFTTGPYAINGAEKKYGQYLTIWKTDNNTWKLAMELTTNSNKPLNNTANQFIEPKDHHMPAFINKNEIKAGKDIILTTEKTLNTMLKAHGIAAFAGFLRPDARLIFPGNEALNGTNEILAFYNGMVSKINLKTTGVDKALGSDFAYTYGVATIDYKTDFRESFNYVFVYEKSADSTWNLLVQAFTPAER